MSVPFVASLAPCPGRWPINLIEQAGLTARYLVLGDRPAQAAAAVPSLLASGDPNVAAFERYLREHLPGPVRISAAARAIGVSERTLQRATASTLGMTPAQHHPGRPAPELGVTAPPAVTSPVRAAPSHGWVLACVCRMRPP